MFRTPRLAFDQRAHHVGASSPSGGAGTSRRCAIGAVSLLIAIGAGCGGGAIKDNHKDAGPGDAPVDRSGNGGAIGSGGVVGAGGAGGAGSGGFTGGAGGASSGGSTGSGGAAGSTGGSMAAAGGAPGPGGTAGTACQGVPPVGAPVGLVVDFVPGVVVTTLAGSATAGSAEGTGAGVGLSNPVSIDVSPSGDLFVAEYDANRIRRITSTGTSSPILAAGLLEQPFGFGVVSDGLMYLETDKDPAGFKSNQTGTIWRVDVAAGTAVPVKADIGRPRGVGVLPDGRLVLSDFYSNRIWLLDPQTGALTPLAGNGCPGFANGQGEAAQFNAPYGLAVRGGIVIVADWGNHRLRTVTTTGMVGTFAGDGINGLIDGDPAQARFFNPQAVAFDQSGALYISDQGNHRIRRLASGRVRTLAGDGTAGFNDGAGNAAAFYGQEGIAVRPDGRTVYVADGNLGDGGPYHRVRALAIPGP